MLRQLNGQAHAGGQAGARGGDTTDLSGSWRAALAAQAVPVYRWVYSQVGNREQAEALTTRVFDQAARCRGPVAAPASEAARVVLFQIARTVVAEELRAFYGAAAGVALDRLSRAFAEEIEPMATDDTVRANLAVRRAHELLAHLPARERELLSCRFLLGYPIERTAERLHLSVAETMALQFVALQHASQLDSVTPALDDTPEDAHMHEQDARAVLETCGCH